ncbi:MAG: hypothetical protein HXY38_13245 [Chloroflexi bacterium]|nr:hypothetical protein [Chloroflexota bacterium]
MNETNQFNLMFEAFAEILREEKDAKPAPRSLPAPALPNLSTVLAQITPLPQEALFLGMAMDGLPVLLNLRDPVPGPLLIAGDPSSGKTRILQTIARATDLLHSPDHVQYVIVTTNPDEWKALHGSENNAGIYHASKANTGELLQSLVTWAHQNRGDGQSVLLLVDDLEAIAQLEAQIQQNLRWLLLRGPSRRVWTFATMNANRAEDQKDWLGLFRTRLFACVEDMENAKLLTGMSPLNHLSKGEEFAMREGEQLLKFWLPAIVE